MVNAGLAPSAKNITLKLPVITFPVWMINVCQDYKTTKPPKGTAVRPILVRLLLNSNFFLNYIA